LKAVSISWAIAPLVQHPDFEARVLAGFARACDLITLQGDLLALVHPSVGNGPLNIVLDTPLAFEQWPKGTVVLGDGCALAVEPHGMGAGLQIELRNSRLWNPKPDWETLRTGLLLRRNLDYLHTYLQSIAPENSLAQLLNDSNEQGRSGWQAVAVVGIAGLEDACRKGELDAVHKSATLLCGLGPGLTPSGDDWLAGWLVGMRLNVEAASLLAIGEAILTAAQDRTNTISLAFLQCAAQGQVAESWHHLLSALAWGNEHEVKQAAARALAFGATSGADMMTGFLQAARQAGMLACR
jgi:hypothetical protein